MPSRCADPLPDLGATGLGRTGRQLWLRPGQFQALSTDGRTWGSRGNGPEVRGAPEHLLPDAASKSSESPCNRSDVAGPELAVPSGPGAPATLVGRVRSGTRDPAPPHRGRAGCADVRRSPTSVRPHPATCDHPSGRQGRLLDPPRRPNEGPHVKLAPSKHLGKIARIALASEGPGPLQEPRWSRTLVGAGEGWPSTYKPCNASGASAAIAEFL